MNEWYLEELSDNIKSVLSAKKKKGSHIGSFAPYGYKKDPKNRGHLIIDEIAAGYVKRIFQLYCRGFSIDTIVKKLNGEGVLPPALYKIKEGYKIPNFNKRGTWSHYAVLTILHNQVYIGNMVSNYSKKVSYKSKKIVNIPESERIIVEGTHDAIITKEQFLRVKEMIQQKRRACKNGKPHIFAGKVKCMDCGSSLVKKNTEYLRCNLYSQNPEKCTTHSIPIKTLQELILAKLREHRNNQELKELSAMMIQKYIEMIYVGEKKNGKREIKINWAS